MCVGVVMKKVNNKQFIQKQLDVMFSNMKHSQVEREVCRGGECFKWGHFYERTPLYCGHTFNFGQSLFSFCVQ